MAEALRKGGGHAAHSLPDRQIDAPIAKIDATWPGNVKTPHAAALGLQPDADFETVVHECLRENPDAVKRGASP